MSHDANECNVSQQVGRGPKLGRGAVLLRSQLGGHYPIFFVMVDFNIFVYTFYHKYEYSFLCTV